jgi:hypothetical protein
MKYFNDITYKDYSLECNQLGYIYYSKQNKKSLCGYLCKDNNNPLFIKHLSYYEYESNTCSLPLVLFLKLEDNTKIDLVYQKKHFTIIKNDIKELIYTQYKSLFYAKNWLKHKITIDLNLFNKPDVDWRLMC